MSEENLSQLRDAIIELDAQKAEDAARKGLEAGMEPLDMINNGIRFALVF